MKSETIVILGFLLFSLVSIGLITYQDIQRDKHNHALELKAIENGLEQKVVDGKVIWTK